MISANTVHVSPFQLKEVNRHPWACAGGKGEMELEAPMMDVVQTHIIPARDAIDDDVLRGITSIGCFKVQWSDTWVKLTQI